MTFRSHLFVTVALLAFFGFSTACAVDPSADPELNVPNNGADLTRPPRSFDFRDQYLDKPNGVYQNSTILRFNAPFKLGSGGWKWTIRMDLPFVSGNATNAGNPNGAAQFGLGNVLLQAVVVDDISKRWAGGFGVRATVPTATQPSVGNSYTEIGPVGAVRSMLPEISPGSYALVAVRYQSFLGGGPNYGTIYWSPTVSFALPDNWFFILYPSQDISIRMTGDGKWFVPIDVALGKNLSKTQLLSLELGKSLVKEYTSYDFKMEARYSIFF